MGQLFFRVLATNSEKEIVQKQAFLLTQLLLKRAFLMSESFLNKEKHVYKKILKWCQIDGMADLAILSMHTFYSNTFASTENKLGLG